MGSSAIMTKRKSFILAYLLSDAHQRVKIVYGLGNEYHLLAAKLLLQRGSELFAKPVHLARGDGVFRQNSEQRVRKQTLTGAA